ncbi:hypothetical protein LOTGIDRAFT_93877, partial [Lottia gigantea]
GGLTDLWNNAKHTDVRIYVEDRLFACHRVVLASMSAYFDAMFTSDMKETREGVVYLKNMKAHVFDMILKYIYKGETSEMFPEFAVDVLYASSLLQIVSLQELCEKYFSDNLTLNSCLEIWRLSCTMHCINLKDNAWTFFMDNFVEVSHTDEFLEMSKDELLLAINDDNMNVENEELVCDAVLRWFEHDRKRVYYLLEIFHNLRLALMSYAYIDCITRRKAYIADNSECSELLEQMKHVSARAEIVYGQPHIFREHGKAACTLSNDIYVSGGTSSFGSAETRFVRFETKRNRWEYCLAMREPRCYHELVTVGHYIYTIGGFAPEDAVSNVERYDTIQKEWTRIGNLAIPVGGMSATALNGIIFVFGG